MEIMNVTLVNVFGGSFFGNLLTALSVSSSPKDVHDNTKLANVFVRCFGVCPHCSDFYLLSCIPG
jgi:hypothetical protein